CEECRRSIRTAPPLFLSPHIVQKIRARPWSSLRISRQSALKKGDRAMTAFTYPGVYIEELPSGQHNITGVATSIAAFIGWANQGPVGEAVMIESWPEYVATFGGFYPGAYLGYAVYQYFQNQGSQAYIIRLVAPSNGNAGTPVAATATAPTNIFG